MTTSDLTDLVKLGNARTEALCLIKGIEYGTEENRFQNFETIQQINSLIKPDKLLTKAGTIWSTMAKQLASIIDMINGDKPLSVHMINEKFGDVHVYEYCLEGHLLDLVKYKENLNNHFESMSFKEMKTHNEDLREMNNFDRVNYIMKEKEND